MYLLTPSLVRFSPISAAAYVYQDRCFPTWSLDLEKKGWGGGAPVQKIARKRGVSIPPAGSRGHIAPLTRNRGGKLFPADALRQRIGPEIAHLGVWSVSPVIFDGLL